nr:AEC family transporter [Mangrovicoccus algicola]
MKVAEAVTPVIVLAAAGIIWVRSGLEYSVQFVTRLTMSLGMPCLVFVALMRTEIDPTQIRALGLASAAGYGILTLGAAGLLALAGLSQRTYLGPAVFGNTGNLGLPLALFAFGPTGFDYAIVVFAVMVLWSFTFGIWIVAGGGGVGPLLREPIVGATLLGLLFLWQGWHLPAAMTNTLELTGQMAIPLMLLTLGVAVARLRPGGIALAALISALKLVACIATGWAVGSLAGLAPEARAVLVLQLSTPIAVTSYMLAEKYGADAQAVAGLVVVSTAMSLVALPLLLALLL